VALGYLRVSMGIPLYLVTLWLTYVAIRSAPPRGLTDETVPDSTVDKDAA
jgi:hypothetical protein